MAASAHDAAVREQAFVAEKNGSAIRLAVVLVNARRTMANSWKPRRSQVWAEGQVERGAASYFTLEGDRGHAQRH